MQRGFPLFYIAPLCFVGGGRAILLVQCKLQQRTLSPKQLYEVERKMNAALKHEKIAGDTITRLLVTGADISPNWKPMSSGQRDRWFVVDIRSDERFFAPFSGVLGANAAASFLALRLALLWWCRGGSLTVFCSAVTDAQRRSINIGSESALTAIFGEDNKDVVHEIMERRRKAPFLNEQVLLDAVPRLDQLRRWKEVRQFLVY